MTYFDLKSVIDTELKKAYASVDALTATKKRARNAEKKAALGQQLELATGKLDAIKAVSKVMVAAFKERHLTGKVIELFENYLSTY